MRRLTVVLVFPLLSLACGGEPIAPDASSGSDPGFSFGNNPDNGNPRIVRFGALAGFLLIDPPTDLFSLQAGTNAQFGCNVPPDIFTFMDVQQIIHDPDDPEADRITEVRLGRDIYIAVFDGFSGWVASGFDCVDLLSRIVGEGYGNFTYSDNDLLAFLRENTSANAFGFVAHGELELVGGGTAHYGGVSRCVWDGEDLASTKCNDRINLR